MKVLDWFDAWCVRRGHASIVGEYRLRTAEAQWAGGLQTIAHSGKGLPANPPSNIRALIAAGITPDDWGQYMLVHSSGCLGRDAYRLMDVVTQEPEWGPVFGLPSSPARMVLFHASGITPTLLARWMAGQQVSWSEQGWSPAKSPTRLWIQMVDLVAAMTRAGVPLEVAGLYVLAGYDTDEAAGLSTTSGSSTVESLRVEVELALPYGPS